MLVCRLSALFAWVWFGQVFFVLKMLGWLGLLRRRIWADWVQKTRPMSISAWTVSLVSTDFCADSSSRFAFRARTNRHRQSETKTMPTPRPPPLAAADVESLKSAVAVTVQLCYVM